MQTPRTMAASHRVAIMLFCLSLLLCVASPATRAQEQPSAASPDTARGIKLYQQGNTEEAIKLLKEVVKERPDDADAWYYMGLAYEQDGREYNARTAFEHVVTLRPDFADALAKLAYSLFLGSKSERAALMAQRALAAGDNSAETHYVLGEVSLRADDHAKALQEAGAALKIKPDMISAWLLKGMAHYGLKQYEEAAESFRKLLALSPDNHDADTWQIQLEHLRMSAANAREQPPPAPEAEVFSPRQVTVKARILHKSEPSYTEEARRAGVEGTVVLRAVFSSDSTLKNIFVVKWLPGGLTTEAVRAAKQIKFVPASIDGRPVSQYIQIEYNFSLF